MKQWVIIGAGGLGREVLWAATNLNKGSHELAMRGFCDDAVDRQAGDYCGLPLLGSPEGAAKTLGPGVFFTCAIGSNKIRAAVVARALALGWIPQTIIDPSVQVAPGVQVAEGTYVGALSVLSPNARLGRHVIVNHGASIGHDSRLDDFTQVCPGGRISGGCAMGKGSFVGSNGVLAPGVTLGEYAMLGAASFAMKPIPAGCSAVGNPARIYLAPVRPVSPSSNETR